MGLIQPEIPSAPTEKLASARRGVMNYIDIPIEEALKKKWEKGRDRYGPEFVGDPQVELDEELLDGCNYAAEAARQGRELGNTIDLLRMLRRRNKEQYDKHRSATGADPQR